MKKIVTASVALLSVITLAACSGKSASESSDKASSSVENFYFKEFIKQL